MIRFLPVGLAVLLLAVPAAAGSRRCGDDVDGRGRTVPCACGDVLVSSRTLGPGDPVTQQVCDGTALSIQAPAGRPPVTLDLGGQTLAGSRHGIGIQVIDGGRGGATIAGPGTVSGFDTGILAPRGLAMLRDVRTADNVADGVNVGGSGYEVRGCEAVHNGRDGFTLRGRGSRLDGNHAVGNGRDGFRIAGRDAQVGTDLGNEGAGNSRDGLRIRGRGHALTQPVTTANGGVGIRAHVSHGRIAGAATSGNAQDGLHAAGAGLTVAGSSAAENGGTGIRARGARVVDGGDNRAGGNRGRRGDRVLPRPECTVGAPCR